MSSMANLSHAASTFSLPIRSGCYRMSNGLSTSADDGPSMSDGLCLTQPAVVVKGCALPALKPHACERAGEPAGRHCTSLDGGNRGVLRCGGELTRLWRLKRSHYQSGDGELRQTRR